MKQNRIRRALCLMACLGACLCALPGGALAQGVESGYAQILDRYYETLRAAYFQGVSETLLQETGDLVNPYCLYGYGNAGLHDIGYAFSDLDGNGTQELVIGDLRGKLLLDVYTLANGLPVRVLRSAERSRYSLCAGGLIAHEYSNGAASSAHLLYAFENGALVVREGVVYGDFYNSENEGLCYYTQDGDYDTRNDRVISDEEAARISAGYLAAYVQLPLTAFSAYPGGSSAPAQGTAVIDGLTADRVHLRAEMSTDSTSMGLFFTGTPVAYELAPGGEWAAVTVGTQNGYMMAKYLHTGSGAVQSRQPEGVVTAGSVNVRGEPSLRAPVVGTAYRGDSLAVLGETAGHWYYVRYGNLYGYIHADYVSLTGDASQGAAKGTAVIDGLTADRVHLRAEMSTDSTSMGLFFTGTPVAYELAPGGEWAAVTVGTQNGYMMAKYLHTGQGAVQSRQPEGVVTAGSVNVRGEPSLRAPVVGTAYRGDSLAVLGETAGHWYYVRYGNLYGYIFSDYLSLK